MKSLIETHFSLLDAKQPFYSAGNKIDAMTEKIIDEFFSRKIFIETEDIFSATAELGNIIEKLGARQRENIYETDGPRKRASVIYILTKLMDRHARAKILFDIKADSMLNIMTLTISASFEIKSEPEAGFFSKAFYDFYAVSTAPLLKRMAIEEIRSIWKQVEYQLRLRFKYSYA